VSDLHSGAWSLTEQRFEITPAMYYAENENVLSLNTVDDDVLAHGEAARPNAEIFVTGAASVREGSEKNETAGNRVNQTGRNIHAATFFGYVDPNVVKISLGPWRYTMRH
jgi:hypothetical protein